MNSQSLAKGSSASISHWLCSLGYKRYVQTFIKSNLDEWDKLYEITKDQLVSIGVLHGHSIRICNKIKIIQQNSLPFRSNITNSLTPSTSSHNNKLQYGSISHWLYSLGYQIYVPTFLNNNLDEWNKMYEITKDQLISIGILRGHAIRICSKIKTIQQNNLHFHSNITNSLTPSTSSHNNKHSISVSDWLCSLGYQRYVHTFINSNLHEWNKLYTITEDQLISIGVLRGHSLRICKKIKIIQQTKSKNIYHHTLYSTITRLNELYYNELIIDGDIHSTQCQFVYSLIMDVFFNHNVNMYEKEQSTLTTHLTGINKLCDSIKFQKDQNKYFIQNYQNHVQNFSDVALIRNDVVQIQKKEYKKRHNIYLQQLTIPPLKKRRKCL